MDTTFETMLSESGYRVTKPRKVVFAALKQHETPIAIKELVTMCERIDRVSVYRAIDLFTSLSIVNTVPSGWKHRYELAEPFKPHHHHMQCSVCAKIVDVHSRKLEHLIESVAQDHEFTISSHMFELRGICKNCSTVSSS